MKGSNLKLIVFVGPSAVGKTYTAEMLLGAHARFVEQAKVHTNRPARSNQQSTDRIHVSTAEFDRLVTENCFRIHGDFGPYRYGFSYEHTTPSTKHMITNIWPELIPEFSHLDNVLFVGMQPDRDTTNMLINRMRLRGDNEETIKTRLELIASDSQMLEKHRQLIEHHGKMFVITNDDSVKDKIIPWIESELQL